MRCRSVLVTCLALTMSVGCYSSFSSSKPTLRSGELAKNQREVTGRIVSYTTAPRGEMDGFVLDTGNRVSFPINAGSALLPYVQKGDAVTVVGVLTDEPEGKVLEAISITNLDKDKSIDVEGISPPPARERQERAAKKSEAVPPPGKASSTTTLTGAQLTSHEGRVKGYTTAPTGDMDGVLLDSGARVHFPAQAGKAVLPLVGEGKSVRVIGWEITGPEGTILEATKIVSLPGGQEIDIAEVAPPPAPKVTPGAVAPPGAAPLGSKPQAQQQQQQQRQERTKQDRVHEYEPKQGSSR